jgi:hypothetical protein
MLISKFKELIYFTHCVHYNTVKFVNVHGKKAYFHAQPTMNLSLKKTLLQNYMKIRHQI